MIFPIVAYGDPVLVKKAQTVADDYPKLKELVANMFETMYNAEGVGLAAPQIGLSLRIFVIDSTLFDEKEKKNGKSSEPDDENQEPTGLKRAFINPEKIDETGKVWKYEEGCLSIPKITENVSRPDTLHLRYYDEDFNEYVETFTGLTARVIQHEYDHIEGILFLDHLKPLRRQLLKGRLNKISKGNVKVPYRMRFPNAKRRR